MKKKLLTFFATHERTFNFVKVILWIFVFFIWFNVFRLPLDSAPENFVILIVLLWIAGFFALPFYLLPKLNDFINIKINEVKQKIREEFLGSVDIADICMEMLEAVQQKYRYTNYDTTLENYSDWMAFQVKHNRKKDLTKDKEFMVTYDNVLIASNKFLDWLLHTNYIVAQFFSAGSAIEVNLLSKILTEGVFDNFQLRIKITTKEMERRGKGELAEIRFNLGKKDIPSYEEIIMMENHFQYIESWKVKEMEDSDTVEVIQFMQKFIKNTRKLIR
jgi:hypothetical protein